jgi:23S rRNA (guanosine2251-2'-O)-methyltransferase
VSSKKGPTTGTGGHGRRRLEGKGPTPKAEHRPGHPAQRRSKPTAKRAGPGKRGDAPTRGGTDRQSRRPTDVVAGRNPVVEALAAEVPATGLLVARGVEVDKRITDAIRLANQRGLPVREVARAELERVTGGAHHQGLALTIPAYSYLDPDDLLTRATDTGDAPLLVALDGVTDPHNLGAVVRSAAAFGAHGVVVPERRSAGMTAGAWKASAGAAARVPVARATNLPRTLKAYSDAGVLVAGLAGDGDVALADLDGTAPLCLVVGSEGRGLSRLVGERCDLRVAIPLGPPGAGSSPGIESLNASVAAGIALYAVSTARRAAGRL